MQTIIDLDRYPIDRPDSAECGALIARSKQQLARDGLFNLPGFMQPDAVLAAVDHATPLLAEHAFAHIRQHTIYFRKSVDGLPDDHPALRQFETANSTICADQLTASSICALYAYPPFAAFLAAIMDRPALYQMDDPLAGVNVMGYCDGQALNWHFDRSEFTTTLLLQAPETGGAFEYAKDLRSDTDPNYAGVADLIDGKIGTVVMPLEAGTLNVFRGKNTAHRVTTVRGARGRIIAVFSYFDRPGVSFTVEERTGFYGRAS